MITILEMRPGWDVRQHNPTTSFPTKSCVTWAGLLEHQSCKALKNHQETPHGA